MLNILKVMGYLLAISILLISSNIYQYLEWSYYSIQFLAFVLALTLVLVFLKYPLPGRFHLLDYVFSLASIISCGYIMLYYGLIYRTSDPLVSTLILGIILVIVVTEAIRRVFGIPLSLLITIFTIYPFIGSNMPGLLQTRIFTVNRIIDMYYHQPNGIMGLPLSVTVNIVAIYILLGAFFNQANATDYMTKLALFAFGKVRGGPAKIAVVTSSFLGTITGNPASNVATTGVLTIPLMKKFGYRSETAAAVEVSASTGGLIMPPIMGSIAFLMAEFLSVPYSEIILYALVPAILYYLGMFLLIDLDARNDQLKTISVKELPSFKDGWRALYLIGVPLSVLVFFIFALNQRPNISGLAAIASMIIVSYFAQDTKLTPSKILAAFSESVNSLVNVVLVTAGAGIIIGSILLTGLGSAFIQGLFLVAGTSLFLGLLLTGIACIILGMGMPIVGVYIVLVMLVVPGLVELGSTPISAHFLIFYFGILSAITPPVCIPVYVAAAIADSKKIIKIALESARFSFVAFVLPFLMVYNPSLILVQGNAMQKTISVILAVVFVILFSLTVSKTQLKWSTRALTLGGVIISIWLLVSFIETNSWMG